MFERAEHCVVRIANAAAPADSFLLPRVSYNPNMAIKCFVNGTAPSANLANIWTIDGYDVLPADGRGKPTRRGSCSMFDVPLSNHCDRRGNVRFALRHGFIPAFNKVDPDG